MNDSQAERLYSLLPAIYRLRDTQQGQPLRALMAVLQSQALNLQADMEALYDNWFIETADDWVVPYIADLVGITDLSLPRSSPFSQRRRVANTLAYRRRKGTLATLEHILQDVSGWGVHVLELGSLVAASQHLSHLRWDNRLVNLRHEIGLTRLDGSFDRLVHTTDVGDLTTDPSSQRSSMRGKYRPDHLGIYVWRLNSYPVYNSPAYPVRRSNIDRRRLPAGCFTFDPLGRDIQLFNQPLELKGITSRVMPVHLPLEITREILREDLDSHRSGPAGQGDRPAPRNSLYYGPDRSLLILSNDTPIPPAAVASADLSQWQVQAGASPAITALIDPQLGRFMLLDVRPRSRARIEVSYNYGFSADLGGGSYPRYLSLIQPSQDAFQVDLAAGSQVDSLKKALEAWEQVVELQPACQINILDSGVYEEDDLIVHLPRNGLLTIQAVDGARPVFRFARGLTFENPHAGASLNLNGLTMDGRLTFTSGIQVSVSHCTLMPDGIGVLPQPVGLSSLQVAIDSSICGPIRLPSGIRSLAVTNSLLDGYGEAAIAGVEEGASGPPCSLSNATIFGLVRTVRIVQASAVIFNHGLVVEDVGHGLVSFCYLAPGSRTPRRDHCQPEGSEGPVPRFTSTRFGDPGYAQLSSFCPESIRRGAEDGSEIGVFHDQFNSQRQDNLTGKNTAILDGYLPFELTPGLFYVT